MKIAILGTGSIGSYIAAKLSFKSDNKLFLLARSNYIAIKEHGLILTDVEFSQEEFVHKNFSITNDIQTIPKCDIVIICVKSHQTSEILQDIQLLCHSHTIVITLQNGFNFENEIVNALPKDTPLFSGTCWIKVSTLAPNHIRHDFGTLIKLGQYSGKLIDGKPWINLFQGVGLTIELTHNIKAAQLTKLALNVPFFALSAKTGKSISEILADPTLNHERELLQAEISQASALINACIDETFLTNIIDNLKKIQITPPSSREILIERMTAELPQNAGTLLDFFQQKQIELHALHNIYSKLI